MGVGSSQPENVPQHAFATNQQNTQSNADQSPSSIQVGDIVIDHVDVAFFKKYDRRFPMMDAFYAKVKRMDKYDVLRIPHTEVNAEAQTMLRTIHLSEHATKPAACDAGKEAVTTKDDSGKHKESVPHTAKTAEQNVTKTTHEDKSKQQSSLSAAFDAPIDKRTTESHNSVAVSYDQESVSRAVDDLKSRLPLVARERALKPKESSVQEPKQKSLQLSRVTVPPSQRSQTMLNKLDGHTHNSHVPTIESTIKLYKALMDKANHQAKFSNELPQYWTDVDRNQWREQVKRTFDELTRIQLIMKRQVEEVQAEYSDRKKSLEYLKGKKAIDDEFEAVQMKRLRHIEKVVDRVMTLDTPL